MLQLLNSFIETDIWYHLLRAPYISRLSGFLATDERRRPGTGCLTAVGCSAAGCCALSKIFENQISISD
jgi:hypothetical protein